MTGKEYQPPTVSGRSSTTSVSKFKIKNHIFISVLIFNLS